MLRIVLKLLCLSYLTFPCFCQTGDETIALVNTLFSNYSTKVRPNKDHSKATQVDLDMYLVGINDLDEVEGKFTTDEPAMVMQIYLSQADIWKPDITLKNGFTKLSELGTDFVRVKVMSMGLVTWLPFEVFNSKCSINIRYFPFDVQSCDFVFVVWSSESTDVNVTLGSKGMLLEDIDESGEWKILSTSSQEDREGIEAKVTFSLEIERNSRYYLFNIIIPVILLGLLNVFTFVIPADSGEKMGYAMTVFLSFAVFLTIVSAELRKSSGSYLGYYLMTLLGLGVITVCFTAFELRLHFRTSPVPKWVVKTVTSPCCFC